MDINKIINILRTLKEDAIANTVGGGAIAGTAEAGDDPPMNKKKKKPPILARGKMPGARKRWSEVNNVL
ncbi:MAG: hypothetical protein CMA57_01930 [Euryarchaeota archaeon]|jgi:hypothetical protein|nr:hypothetical protein [Euryarchaeota archaeon]|tara:strand:- start:886 stop:1092 length:207 start_codon:yes stop_codon:yes gene_type:complete